MGWLLRLSIVVAHYYYAVVFAWAVLHWAFGDRWWWLFLLNVFSRYLFLPLSFVLILVIVARRRDVTLGFVLVLALGGFLHGRLLLPPLRFDSPPEPAITVMTANVFGYNTEPRGAVESIRAADADVVAIQELNFRVAEAIRQDLSDIYPFQELVPHSTVRGLGILSRYPLRPVEAEFEGDWVGGPQVVEVIWEEERVILVNFHAVPPGPLTPSNLSYSISEREQQARELVAFAAGRDSPVILLGDLNATEQNVAYEILTDSLQDAWIGGGWGMGHTFPGYPATGNEERRLGGIWSPSWLLRLDYILYSDAWQVEKAWIGSWSGLSDHRPVVARLALRP